MKVFFGSLQQRFLVTLRGFVRRLFPQHDSDTGFSREWHWALLETGLFCSITLASRFWFAPEDPFGLEEQFPWVWIVPALLAMRYGTAIGVIAVVFMLCSWLFLHYLGVPANLKEEDFPKMYFTGGLLLILVCGQFSDMWNAHIHRLRVINAYLDERLGTLTKNHYLLRLSHDRLEQDLLGKPMTLRETLIRLRELTAIPTDKLLPGAQEFIHLLGQTCQLEIAALYGMDDKEAIVPEAMATLGATTPVALDDPLLQYCLEQRTLSHVQTSAVTAEARDGSRYLVCAPLVTSQHKLVGMLLIEKLPFFALNDNALQQLTVFAGFYADGIAIGEASHDVLEAVPACPQELALDIVRLHRIKVDESVESTLVVLVFEKDGRSNDMYEQARRLNRGVDISWSFSGQRRNALLTLLTLASSVALEGYLMRIESALKRQSGVDFLEGGVSVHVAALGLASPADTLKDLVDRCEV